MKVVKLLFRGPGETYKGVKFPQFALQLVKKELLLVFLFFSDFGIFVQGRSETYANNFRSMKTNY